MKRALGLAVWGYGVLVAALWLMVALLTDSAWLPTLVAFGPRWFAVLPLLPLGGMLLFVTGARRRSTYALVLALSALVLVFGFLDGRTGLGRSHGPPVLRLLTHNLGASHVTADALDRLLREQRVDVAALQECPFYDYSPARLGWRFYYGGDLCLVSRFPFTVLDEPDPDNVWRRYDREPILFDIDAPGGHFQLLNVHLATIREGIETLPAGGWHGLSAFVSNRDQAALESRRARAKILHRTAPVLVVGDFNVPVESAIYRESWGDLGNAFSRCGRGFGHTKFTRLFGIRIDHVLMSERWGCTDAQVLSSPYGGDHAPLVVDLVTLR